jgi:hypothetical protein
LHAPFPPTRAQTPSTYRDSAQQSERWQRHPSSRQHTTAILHNASVKQASERVGPTTTASETYSSAHKLESRIQAQLWWSRDRILNRASAIFHQVDLCWVRTQLNLHSSQKKKERSVLTQRARPAFRATRRGPRSASAAHGAHRSPSGSLTEAPWLRTLQGQCPRPRRPANPRRRNKFLLGSPVESLWARFVGAMGPRKGDREWDRRGDRLDAKKQG